MKVITAAEFDEIINNGTTVVDFFADWCGPCKMLGPVMEEVDKDYADIEFVKVNIDDNMELAERFGIMSIPQVYVFKDGNVVGKMGGYQDKNGVKSFIDSSLA